MSGQGGRKDRSARYSAELAAMGDLAELAAEAMPEPGLYVDTIAGPLGVDADLLDAWTTHGWPTPYALAALAAQQQRGDQV